MLTISDPPFVLDLSGVTGIPYITMPVDFKWPTDTAECIALSAKKWEFISQCCCAIQQKIGGGLTSGTCALCHKFGKQFNSANKGCENKEENCPVADADHWGCVNTGFATYCGAKDWLTASKVASEFADFLSKLKPTPKKVPFKGFCVGASHDGYVGIKLTALGEDSIVIEADIAFPANCLLRLAPDGVHFEKHIAPSAPFMNLLDADGKLKQV